MKEQVITWAKQYNPDISSLKVSERVSRYGIDIRIYSGRYSEFTNKKSSFRVTKKIIEKTDENGRPIKIGYEGMRGIHSTQVADSILINEEDWDFENKKPKDEEFIVFMNSSLFPLYKTNA